jgi:hypothetical protein
VDRASRIRDGPESFAHSLTLRAFAQTLSVTWRPWFGANDVFLMTTERPSVFTSERARARPTSETRHYEIQVQRRDPVARCLAGGSDFRRLSNQPAGCSGSAAYRAPLDGPGRRRSKFSDHGREAGADDDYAARALPRCGRAASRRSGYGPRLRSSGALDGEPNASNTARGPRARDSTSKGAAHARGRPGAGEGAHGRGGEGDAVDRSIAHRSSQSRPGADRARPR